MASIVAYGTTGTSFLLKWLPSQRRRHATALSNLKAADEPNRPRRAAIVPYTPDVTCVRREFLSGGSASLAVASASTLLATGIALCPGKAHAVQRSVQLPMSYFEGAYFCELSISSGKKIRAQLDTGSPFLILTEELYEGQGERTLYPNTYERYTSQEGEVQWDLSTVSFGNADAGIELPEIVFGVFKTQVEKGGRGAQCILGLVRNADPDIRPSLLSQTDIHSFSMDFVRKTLTLSWDALIPGSADYVELVDLRTFWRAPVQQYVSRVKTLVVNDQVVRTPEPIYAMIDTGVSGVFVNDDFFYPLQALTRGWRSMDVELETRDGGIVTLSSSRRSDPLFICLPTRFPWLPPNANLVVLGLSFLQQKELIIDTVESRVLLA